MQDAGAHGVVARTERLGDERRGEASTETQFCGVSLALLSAAFPKGGGRQAPYRFSRTQAMLPITVAISSSVESKLRMGRSHSMNSTSMGCP